MTTRKTKARQYIDALPVTTGCHVCDLKNTDLQAVRGAAIREWPLDAGSDFPEYLDHTDIYLWGAKAATLTAQGAALAAQQ